MLSLQRDLKIAEWASVICICLTFSVGYWVFLVFTTCGVGRGTYKRINMKREKKRERDMNDDGRKSVKSERRKVENSRTQLLAREREHSLNLYLVEFWVYPCLHEN